MLDALVPNIQETSSLVAHISAASREMASGAAQVNNSIQELDDVVQRNSSSSEELATAATELSSQADQLAESIGFFQMNESDTAPKPTEFTLEDTKHDDEDDEDKPTGMSINSGAADSQALKNGGFDFNLAT